MRIQRQTILKTISEDGILTIDSPEVKEFARLHPGRECIIRFELLPVPPSKKSLAYYWNYVCPTVQNALYEKGTPLTLAETDDWIRKTAPVTRREFFDGENLSSRTLVLSEMDSAIFNEMIEWLKEFAAENLDCIIDEPAKKRKQEEEEDED